MYSLTQKQRRELVTTTDLKVRYTNALREIVGKRCPVNKAGSPLVSDYDLLDASEEEQLLALEKVKTYGNKTS